MGERPNRTRGSYHNHAAPTTHHPPRTAATHPPPRNASVRPCRATLCHTSDARNARPQPSRGLAEGWHTIGQRTHARRCGHSHQELAPSDTHRGERSIHGGDSGDVTACLTPRPASTLSAGQKHCRVAVASCRPVAGTPQKQTGVRGRHCWRGPLIPSAQRDGVCMGRGWYQCTAAAQHCHGVGVRYGRCTVVLHHADITIRNNA